MHTPCSITICYYEFFFKWDVICFCRNTVQDLVVLIAITVLNRVCKEWYDIFFLTTALRVLIEKFISRIVYYLYIRDS